MGETDYLAGIESELHNLNLNIMELIKVLKEKQNPHPIQEKDESDVLDDIKRLHDDQTAEPSEEELKNIEAEKEFRRQQAGLDRQLKHLGIM